MSPGGAATDLERLGGDAGLRRLMERFVREMSTDFVIGFLFEGKDLARISQHEAELASGLFGGAMPYQGRPLASLHRAMRIHRGHFRRRLFVLRRTLEAEAVPPDLVERWIAHHASMEHAIVLDADCLPDPSPAGDSDRN